LIIRNGIFGPGSNYESRYIPDYAHLAEIVGALRLMGYRIVVTAGSFDILHLDHIYYLEEARSYGDILIVGVDSDEKVKKRKGPDRPIVPQDERVRMLAHLRHVDIITLKEVAHPKWELIKAARPDILIASEGTYTPEQIEQLGEFCGEVVVLQRKSTSSTTGRIRLMLINFSDRVAVGVKELLEAMVRGDNNKGKDTS